MLSRSPAAPRHSLILCASLVQNPMNLGALCRTAEVFRLQTLVLPTLQITVDKAFRKLAASAYIWQPLTACPADQLSQWINQQQANGVTVLALTHHVQAVPLPTFQFPKQSALILGRELTGIPETLIHKCNGVVEIPQFGCVESLNVSVAGAIAAYAYLCQQATYTAE
ncbi:MAG: RNA methyltransferase [Leptolyngbya sp. SIO1D8]|nr:RNA methyltransferase [Leptolyngbya sp. SIO1D8]